MQDRTDAEQEGYRTGQDRCRTVRLKDRRDVGLDGSRQVGSRTSKMQDRSETGPDGCRQDRCRQDGCRTGKIQDISSLEFLSMAVGM